MSQQYEPKRATPKQKQAEIDRRQGEVYRFHLGEGDDRRDYEIAPADDLPASFYRENRDASEMEQIWAILEALTSPETVDAIGELKGAAFRKFVRDWQAWQGAESVSFPESPAS